MPEAAAPRKLAAYGAAAALHPEPDAWAIDAAPYILSLGPRHNGQSLRAAP